MRYKVLMSLVIIALMLIPLSCVQPQEQQEPPQDWVVANETEFLNLCEENNITFFERNEHGPYVSYTHLRMIGNASVQSDGIGFRFEKETGELMDKYFHWRDDLPEELPLIITKEDAMRIANGTQAFLYYIDPDSPLYSIEQTDNPCWVVRVWEEYYDPESNETYTWNVDVVVIDAVTGQKIGHGTPLPC